MVRKYLVLPCSRNLYQIIRFQCHIQCVTVYCVNVCKQEEILAVKAAERAEDIDAVARSVACWNLEDTIFLDYADAVLEESRQKSRPLLPMLKYIDVSSCLTIKL